MIRKLRVVEVLCEDEEHCASGCPMLHEYNDGGLYCAVAKPGEPDVYHDLRTESCKREAVISNSTSELFTRYIGVSATCEQQRERIEFLERQLNEERAKKA